MGVEPDDLLPPTFHLQTIAEKRFGGRLDRVSRVVSIDATPEKERTPEKKDQRPSPLRSMSELQSLSEPSVAAISQARGAALEK